MRQSMLLGLLGNAFFGVSQASLIDFAAQLPQCGLSCILEKIPQSACQTVSNDTCICTDKSLENVVELCLLDRCTRLETLSKTAPAREVDGDRRTNTRASEVARIQADACQKPVRERKVDILAPMAIQITGFLAVPLRLYARWSTMHRFATDDWIMLVCGLLFAVFVVLGQLAGAIAFGEDIWMVSADELTLGLKVGIRFGTSRGTDSDKERQIFFIDESFYLVCLGLTKISVLFFYLRIFPNKTFRRATYWTMGYIILTTTVLLFMQIFQCIPFEFNWLGWKGDFGPHQCLNINTLAFVAGGLSISHDVIILILPLPLLIRLNMSWRKKSGIGFMFSLGIFILITSCVRLQYIVNFTRSLNPTWDFTDPLVWSGVEVSVSMIVVCLPALRTLVQKVIPDLFGSGAASKGTPMSPHKASTGSSTGGYHARSGDGHDYDEERREVARAAKLVEKRRKFFSFVPKDREPNESELELGDRSGGEVRTQIRYGNGGPSPRRNSMESGIHVHTTTTFGDTPGESIYGKSTF
ncbi:CFEM domain-containing protein [Colletotrichum plurivorum]|uniref:CFEM domain-containing protein n=1 Tax=Colletotrichum plurivorum TaxID=2175906 RepID=A0A8H6N5J7_9PEZI|nr:CFEM domain-containing protein [Colletotrichum plurivorum]